MPRQKKDVWYSFKEIIVGGVKRAKCKTCGFEVVNNAARMEKHMRDCRNVDDDDDIQEQSTSSATTTSSAPPAPKKRQTALNVISTNPTRQHESDILVTRYFIATNTPFNAASNKHLAKLVQFLRPERIGRLCIDTGQCYLLQCRIGAVFLNSRTHLWKTPKFFGRREGWKAGFSL